MYIIIELSPQARRKMQERRPKPEAGASAGFTTNTKCSL